MKPSLDWRNLGVPVYVVIGLLIVFAAFFVYELLSYDPTATAPAAEPVSETAYAEQVAELLTDADPANGAVLIETYGCIACHRLGAANNIAPSYEGIAARAAERRPPMPAAAYIYESIVNPSAYVVEGYPNSMIQNFATQLSDRELGDIIAYLLTPEAH